MVQILLRLLFGLSSHFSLLLILQKYQTAVYSAHAMSLTNQFQILKPKAEVQQFTQQQILNPPFFFHHGNQSHMFFQGTSTQSRANGEVRKKAVNQMTLYTPNHTSGQTQRPVPDGNAKSVGPKSPQGPGQFKNKLARRQKSSLREQCQTQKHPPIGSRTVRKPNFGHATFKRSKKIIRINLFGRN